MHSPKYDAFISYSRGPDSEIAAAIQDGLLRMGRMWEPLSSIRIFRDARSLRAGPLEAALCRAITSTRHLIVIASLRSAESRWVMDEIRMFLKDHAAEDILIVITDGNLTWSAQESLFAMDGGIRFPDLGEPVFKAEPLYVDLRWALRNTRQLTLGNERFLDTLSTLMATISSVPKDEITNVVVEDLGRQRRNQQINLGFRGFIGFGVSPLLMLLWGAVYGFSSASVLSPAIYGYVTFLAGFFLTGLVGAFICGAGWRAALGFGVGYLAALPLYVIGSLQPFQNGTTDKVVLALLTIGGFALAGAAGGSLTKGLSWRSGAAIWGTGGVCAVALFLLFPELRPEGISTFIAEGPWMSDRIGLAAHRAINVCGGLFDDRSFELLLPLLLGAGLGGTLFGISMASHRIQIPGRVPLRILNGTRATKAWRIVKLASAASVVLGAIAFAATLTDSYQTRKALAALKAANLGARFPADSQDGDRSGIDAFLIDLRARNALEKLGDVADSKEFSAFISKSIEQFGGRPQSFAANRFEAFPGPDPIRTVAHGLKVFGHPDELERMLWLAEASAHGAKVDELCALARTESFLGLQSRAQKLLTIAKFKPMDTDGTGDWYNRSLLGEAFYEAADVDQARVVLKGLFREIRSSAAKNDSVLIGLSDDIAPASERAIHGTGIWSDLEAQLRDEIETAVKIHGRGDENDSTAVTNFAESQSNRQPALRAQAAGHGGFSQARRVLRTEWKKRHLDHSSAGDVSVFSGDIGQALARTGDLRAARYVAEDIGNDFESYGGPQEQMSQLGVFVSILENSRHL